MSMWYYKCALRQTKSTFKSQHHCWVFSPFFSDVTNYLVVLSGQLVNEWIYELVWVSGGGANLHIHSTAYTKWGKGVELHSNYFKTWRNLFSRKKTCKYVILVIHQGILGPYRCSLLPFRRVLFNCLMHRLILNRPLLHFEYN